MLTFTISQNARLSNPKVNAASIYYYISTNAQAIPDDEFEFIFKLFTYPNFSCREVDLKNSDTDGSKFEHIKLILQQKGIIQIHDGIIAIHPHHIRSPLHTSKRLLFWNPGKIMISHENMTHLKNGLKNHPLALAELGKHLTLCEHLSKNDYQIDLITIFMLVALVTNDGPMHRDTFKSMVMSAFDRHQVEKQLRVFPKIKFHTFTIEYLPPTQLKPAIAKEAIAHEKLCLSIISMMN